MHPVYSVEEVRRGIVNKTKDSSFRVDHDGKSGAISVWKTPKRTRTYPYSRMYYTLGRPDCRPITIIPVVKDEGKDHDRDFVQWDSVSMTSYLGIYTVLAYYVAAARKSPDRVTKFELDWSFVTDKVIQALESNMTPLEWNNRERASVGDIIGNVLEGQDNIHTTTGVPLNDRSSLVAHLRKIGNPVAFMQSSRRLSAAAQKREARILQPREEIVRQRKTTITLSDAQDGIYNWTVDELVTAKNKAMIVDKKNGQILPSYDDLSDSFFKMIFFTNIEELSTSDGRRLTPLPAVAVTSESGEGACFSSCPKLQTCDLLHCTYPPLVGYNRVRETAQSRGNYIRDAYREGLENNFLVYVLGSRNALPADTEIVADHVAG